ncbi:MAG TPA: type IV toxin-antitoxin system AbiEi family antitoxin domain-containing protein [Solirubrobacterales bacterium]|nr:type IV toxin-antitoxin system AbiEi family antitoxin domain-containing protein [Solirubrobacterales bacterium]
MGHKNDTPTSAAARIATRQHGIVTLAQLEEVGVTREATYKRARRGQLHRIHRGVYAVGHRPPSLHARFMAAVLACGEGAVLSHGSAAVLWELLRPLDSPVHVSTPSTSGRLRRPGIHLHRCPSLGALQEPSSSPTFTHQGGGRGGRLQTTRRHNIPVTSIQRTIDDIEGVLPSSLVRRAKRQAEQKGIRLIDTEPKRTRSELEDLFLAILDGDPHRHHIPSPEVNVKLGRHEVDFLWRSQRLVVETDFWAYHRGSTAHHEDRARDLDLRERGWTVLRFDELQLEEEPERVAGDVARALGV